MMEIIFATGNKGKVGSMERYAKRMHVGFSVVQQALDLVEIQADDATAVAIAKARDAYKILGKPVLVDDSSFHIAALGGFPGPYIKFMLSTISIEGILNFMKDKTDRSAYFLSSLVFIDEKGEQHVFEDAPYPGVITTEIDNFDSEKAWSGLHKVFIPDGSDKVLARMTPEDHLKVIVKQLDSYEKFCLWAKDFYKV